MGLLPAACTDIPESELTPSPTELPYNGPDLVVEPVVLEFGEVVLGLEQTLPLYIKNLGNSDLYIQTVEISAGAPPFFLPNPPEAFTIIPNQQVTVMVGYAPTQAIDSGGSLRIVSNDELKPSLTVALKGVGSRGTDDDLDDVTVEEGDCDDTDPSVYPGADEICDALDNDCDNLIDEVENAITDDDEDGYDTCGDDADCADTVSEVHPGAEELCDAQDNNCDGVTDEGFDADADGTSDCADDDEDGVDEAGGDCNDADPTTYPGSEDVCDGADNDCDGTVDNGSDSDGDGTSDCTDDDEDGFTEVDGDCNDANDGQNPEAAELCNGLDEDCDGQVDDGVDADADMDGFTLCSGDCDDFDAAIYPGAVEVCNGRDDDCNGQTDDGLPTQSYYADADADTYGDPAVRETRCSAPAGYVSDNTDCNDANRGIYPGAPEQCNELDDDCDGIIDDGVSYPTFYRDEDADGYGTPDNARQACTAPQGYVSDRTDCNDLNASIHPNAAEQCNSLDDDCDGQVDEGVVTSTWYRDSDNDGFGSATQTVVACARPSGFVANGTDCDDTKASIYPGAPEQCNGVDDDCDGQIDDGTVDSTWYQDLDGDGYGNKNVTKVACSQPAGYVLNNTDCDDARSTINPQASEACNGLDDNCSGQVDEGVQTAWYPDADKDGFGQLGGSPQYACTAPTGYASSATDCDDSKNTVYPGASEQCNGLDDDCDSQIDEGIATSTWYADADADGYGNPGRPLASCKLPTGYVADNSDCDDTRNTVYPGAPETCNNIDDDCDNQIDDGVKSNFYVDTDKDGYGKSGSTPTPACSAPAGYVGNSQDCDDTRASAYPGAPEQCNGLDDDCDSQIDDGAPTSTWYRDADGDTFGAAANTTAACGKPSGYVANNTDCNDTLASVYPGAPEQCNSIDDDCDTLVDEGVPATWYADGDSDGYGNPAVTQVACSQPAGYVANSTDCNDAAATVYPGATETCNAVDDDCDGSTDENVKTSYYIDSDRDGYGKTGSAPSTACSAPTGYVGNSLDCDDSKNSVYPGAPEQCNGVDDDCDSQIDDGVVLQTWYQDADSDGYGNTSVTKTSCTQPTGYVSDRTDCNDTNVAIHPNATEACNNVDDDCDTQVDEGVKTSYYSDADKDGYGKSGSAATQACSAPTGMVANSSDCDDTSAAINPAATELCNGVDDNCNGQKDEGLSTTTWYPDADLDGYGATTGGTSACSKPSGYVASNTDCDDTKATVNPAATEVCNGVDDNCNASTDEGVKTSYYVDGDGDGYGKAGSTATQACSAPSGQVANNTDCDDTRNTTYPGATEQCNSRDDDCDSQIDENVASSTWYRDADSDTWGTAATTQTACSQPSGYVSRSGDCNDSAAAVNPGATEICNAVDDDCDGSTDEGLTSSYYVDADSDGYGASSSTPKAACTAPTGYVSNSGDCNDTDPGIKPGAAEVCDGKDQDCDNQIDEGFGACTDSDDDGDGWTESGGDCNDGNNSIYPVSVWAGATGSEDGSINRPFNTIQEGINAALTSCPIVLVRPGTYNERIDFNGRSPMTVRSTDGAPTTIVDGGAGGSVVTFKLGETAAAVLDGLTIRNGRADYGGGVYILNASPTLQNNIFLDNVSNIGGGGVYAKGGSPDILGNTFEGNVGASAIGTGIGGALSLVSAPASIIQNEFIGNSHILGGAIGIRDSTGAEVLDNIFQGNSVSDPGGNGVGGAMYILNTSLTLDGNLFDSNLASDAAGAVYIYGQGTQAGTTITLVNNTFTGNVAENPTEADPTGLGGALYVYYAIVDSSGNTYANNEASQLGGVVYMKQTSTVDFFQDTFTGNSVAHPTKGSGGVLYCTGSTGSVLESTFSGNTSAYNAAVFLITGCNGFSIADSVFTSNLATTSANGKGAVAYVDNSSMSIVGNTFASNAAGYGAGVLMLQDSAVDVHHNIFRSNTGVNRAGAIWVTVVNSQTATPAIANNLFLGNSATGGAGGAVYLNNAGTYATRANFYNNIFAENAATTSGAALYLGTNAITNVMNNILLTNKTKEAIYASTASTTNSPAVQYNCGFSNAVSNYGGKTGVYDATNLSFDPLFTAYSNDGIYTNDVFTLTSGSLAINAGNPSAAFNDANGTRNDMGAYGGPLSVW